MDSMYREIILEHHKSPHNFGTLDPADYTAEDTNPLCGDQIRMDLRVENNVVTDVAFSGRGCAVSIASATMLTDMVKGMSLDEVRESHKDDMLEEIGIPVSAGADQMRDAGAERAETEPRHGDEFRPSITKQNGV